MKCLVDSQLPPALARYLASRGVESNHTSDVELTDAKDRVIWQHIIDNNAVLISKDQDFLHLASKSEGGRFVWVRLGNCRTQALLQAFQRSWSEVEESFRNGERIVELR